jgi:scyllo-inosose 3-dehydrogenase
MKAFYATGEWAPKKDYTVSEEEKKSGIAYRANKIYKNVKAEVTDRPVPEIKPDEVLLKIGACGICGTDVHMLELGDDNYTIYPEWVKLPLIIGHEASGIVEEVGEKVTTLKRGDLVAVEEMQWCGICENCRTGKLNQCMNMQHIGITMAGAMAEYIAINEKYCWNINHVAENLGDEKKALEAGAMIEPLGVAYNGIVVQSGGIKPGSHVVVFGAGPIGQGAIALANVSGAAFIIAFETNAGRREKAKLMGATHVYDPVELEKQGISASQVVMDVTRGVGAYLCVESAGAPKILFPEMEKCICAEGHINQIGLTAGRTPIDLVTFQTKGGHIHGSSGQVGYGIYPHLIRLMAADKIDMTRCISGRFNLDSSAEAISGAPEAAGKVLISDYLYNK